MTDGVARELEQAEARLEAYVLDRYGINGDALDELCDAAIEVGRLRALAEVQQTVSTNAECIRDDGTPVWCPVHGDLVWECQTCGRTGTKARYGTCCAFSNGRLRHVPIAAREEVSDG